MVRFGSNLSSPRALPGRFAAPRGFGVTRKRWHSCKASRVAALRPWGKDLRWAWPRDGRRETLEGAGVSLAKQYGEQQLDMLHEHAQFEDGSVSVEAGLMAMLDRMQRGGFKVFKHLNDWFEEFRLYHRRDGRVWKEGDDLMAATRYACMMLRYARTRKEFDRMRGKIDYPTAGIV